MDVGQLADPVPSVRELRASWGWQQAGREAQSMGGRLRKSISTGQGMLEFDHEALDQMIVVCEKRRATLRLLTADDLLLMADESRRNREKIEDADEQLQDGIAVLVPLLRRFRNFGDYRAQMLVAS